MNPTIELDRAARVFSNLSQEELIAHALETGDAELSESGAIVCRSGKYTGRTPKDKATVRDATTDSVIWWENNAAMSPETFDHLRQRAHDYAQGKTLYVVDTYAGADPTYRIAVRFVVERPYHALFIRQLLLRPTTAELADFSPDWTVTNAGRLRLDPQQDGVPGEAAIALNLASQEVLIFGTEYAGEMKKSVFTIMNYLLPRQGVLSMHCSANVGPAGDTALFFGLSGTGKTTLSADHDRRLIGDDEHGWSDRGVFNIEGGCYAKCIKLSADGEPEIFGAIREGAVLENVVLHGGVPDYDDATITENTRAAYPLHHIEGALEPSVGGHPQNIVFLTCDALGVLPPIARLTPEQAMYHFLNGYTAKVAGTEAGITEPTITFSACFGAPFLPLHPKVYAEMLGEKIARHDAKVWLVSTGWTGGPYGVGHRMKLAHTRTLIRAAFAGELDAVPYTIDPVFGLHIPTTCPGVPDEVLDPRRTWANPTAYDDKARELHGLFEANIAKFR